MPSEREPLFAGFVSGSSFGAASHPRPFFAFGEEAGAVSGARAAFCSFCFVSSFRAVPTAAFVWRPDALWCANGPLATRPPEADRTQPVVGRLASQ